MLAARKLGPVLLVAMACSQPVGPPRSTPRPAAREEHPVRQQILITSKDLAPIDSKRFLYVFPIESSGQVTQAIQRDEAPLLPSETDGWCLRMNLRRLDRSERRDLLRRLGVKQKHKDNVQIPWSSEAARDKPSPKDYVSSFVIDYDDPRFASFWSQVQKGRGAAPEVSALVDVVAKHIDVKTTTRMFDTASEVAQSRQGDCTEHATLLTALLRRSGKPARLVTGLAVLVEGRELGAFGHAWTELYENGAWQVVDAALHPVPGHTGQRVRAIRYIPVVRMVDEGAGFAAAMANVRSIEAISSVQVQPCDGTKK
jgi:transglutaminase-like putative cysteine protease